MAVRAVTRASLAGEPGDGPKVAMCHYQEGEGTYKYRRLPEPAANAHLKNHELDYLVDTTRDTANCGESGNVCPSAPDACSVPVREDGTCGFAPVECADDGNECTVTTCDPTLGSVSETVVDETVCNDGSGVCVSGICTTPEPVIGSGSSDETTTRHGRHRPCRVVPVLIGDQRGPPAGSRDRILIAIGILLPRRHSQAVRHGFAKP